MLAFLAIPSFSAAQPEWLSGDYLLERWTNADGLPVNGTTDVHLGNRGYLWLATFDGLVRFDGQRFRTFDASSHDGFPGNRLTRLLQQDDDLIWVLTEQYALASFDGRRFHTATTDSGLPADRVLKLHLDARGVLWIGTEGGLARACGPSCFRSMSGEPLDQPVQAFADAREAGVWLGTGSGRVARVTEGRVERVIGARSGLRLADVRALVVDREGVVWAGGAGGLARIQDGSAQMVAALEGAVVNDLELAPDGDLIAQSYERTYRRVEGRWEAVNEGPIAGYVRLVAAGPQGSEWRARQSELLRDGEVVVRAPCPIRDFDFDGAGNVWLATLCDGLWRIRQRRLDAVSRDQGLPEGPVYGLVQDAAGTLWASVGGGMVAEIRDRRVKQLHAAGSPAQVVGTVAADRDGRVWAGKGSLCVFSKGRCRRPSDLPGALRNVLVRSIFEDRSGRFWVASSDGLWQRHAGRWQNLQDALVLPEWVQVQVMLQADSGNLWFGTDSDGLRRLTETGEVDSLGVAEGLRSERIRDLYEDELGRLWVATADSGLCRSDQAESGSDLNFNCIGEREGLYSDSLHRLLSDGLGRFWFNTNSGVFWAYQEALERVLAGKSDRIYPRVYTERDGLPDREGNGGVQNAGVRLRDGRLAFPGQGGIAIFDPAEVEPSPGIPRVVIESLQLPGGRNLAAAQTVRLAAGERDFSVRFAGMKAGLTGTTYFRYRMDDGQWVEIGQDRTLSFDGIGPGRHRLEVAAVDADSGVSGPAARVQLVVPPYLLERASVRAALIALLAAVISTWLWRRRQALIRLQQFLHREVERRTAEAVRQQRIAERALSRSDRDGIEINPSSPGAKAPDDAGDLLADRVRRWVEDHIDDGDLSVARLAEELFMSRSKLHRRLVEETGRSPGEFIRDVRLGVARQLLQQDGNSVSDAAYAVGFSSVSGFSRAYRSHFGESPSETVS